MWIDLCQEFSQLNLFKNDSLLFTTSSTIIFFSVYGANPSVHSYQFVKYFCWPRKHFPFFGTSINEYRKGVLKIIDNQQGIVSMMLLPSLANSIRFPRLVRYNFTSTCSVLFNITALRHQLWFIIGL